MEWSPFLSFQLRPKPGLWANIGSAGLYLLAAVEVVQYHAGFSDGLSDSFEKLLHQSISFSL